MKMFVKKLLFGILLVFVGSLCFTGCDMDDKWERNHEIDLEDEIESQSNHIINADRNKNMQYEIESDMRNVEQRDYATILLVSAGKDNEDYEFTLGVAKEKKVGEKSQNEEAVTFLADDLEDLYENYWSVKGKTLSLVHLKVIILNTPDGGTLMYLWELLDDLEESREIAKTCPVIQLSDKDAFLKYVKEAKEPVGIYLHNLVKINEENGKIIPQVKDYLKVMREDISLPVYYLEKEKEGWVLKCRDEIGTKAF